MILLVPFVILLVRSGNAWLCIGLYMLLEVLFGLLFWPGALAFTGGIAFAFAWAWAYFHALVRLEGTGCTWWVWMLGFPLAGGALELLAITLLGAE